VTVLIADDHPVIRNGLIAFLSREPDVQVVGEARDGVEAEELARALNPEVVVMDIYMPRRSGLEAMVRIKRDRPGVKVLFLTVSGQEEDLLQALRFGADGYLLKKSDLEQIVRAVRQVAAGKAVLSPSMTATILKELQEGRQELALSAREQEVLELIGQGLTNAEIATRLVVAEGTVSTYVYRLLKKLHLKNRAEAMAYFVRATARSEPF